MHMGCTGSLVPVERAKDNPPPPHTDEHNKSLIIYFGKDREGTPAPPASRQQVARFLFVRWLRN